MLKRLTMGLGGILILGLAALASMIRIVPQPPTPEASPTVLELPAAVPALPAPPARAAWGHPLLVVPVQGVSRGQIVDTWGQSRANGLRAHQGTDIIAPGGTPVVAAAAGRVEKLFFSRGGGGITLYVRSPDRQWSYYYAHLQAYAPGMAEGRDVRAGELLGFVGDTGNAGPGNFHLHFGVSHMLAADRWWQGQPVNPYPLLAGSGDRS